MSISDPFSGHYKVGDPRTPLWSAGGSVWPTTPPLRYRLGGPQATGDWLFLKTTGLLFETWATPTHDSSFYWATDGLPAMFQAFAIYRDYDPNNDQVAWLCRYKLADGFYFWDCNWTRPRGKTNVNMDFGFGEQREDIVGLPGPVTLYQVEFNQLLPPGGWPPWPI